MSTDTPTVCPCCTGRMGGEYLDLCGTCLSAAEGGVLHYPHGCARPETVGAPGADTPTTPPPDMRRRREWVDALRQAAPSTNCADDYELLRDMADELERHQTPNQQERAGPAESAGEPSSTGPAEALDLAAIEADLAEASEHIDHPDAPYHWPALAVMHAAEKLAAEVRRLRGEQDAWLRWVDEQVSEAQAGETRAVTRAEAAEAQVRRLAAWLDEHVPARWHRGGTPVEVAIAMLASWSDRGELATALREVEAERDELRARVAELERAELLTPQQCPAGVHPEWGVDSEHLHLCPWCRVADLKSELERLRARRDQLLRQLAASGTAEILLGELGWQRNLTPGQAMWTPAGEPELDDRELERRVALCASAACGRVVEQDAPTTWQLPPEPGEHVQAVQDHAGRIHTRHHGSWVDPDGWYRQWRMLLHERGEVSATPPAGPCCDLHGPVCEPPSELCCWQCTEAKHPQHPPGVACTWATPPAGTEDHDG